MKCDTNDTESSLNEEIEAGVSLLNQAKAEPFSVMVKGQHCTRS